jgi:hypothetical protein
MTNPAELDAAFALSRFGLGARDGSIASIAQNPRGALKDEVTGRVLLTPAGPELPARLRALDRPRRWFPLAPLCVLDLLQLWLVGLVAGRLRCLGSDHTDSSCSSSGRTTVLQSDCCTHNVTRARLRPFNARWRP